MPPASRCHCGQLSPPSLPAGFRGGLPLSLLWRGGRGQGFQKATQRLACPEAEAVELFFTLAAVASVGESVADLPCPVGGRRDALGGEPRGNPVTYAGRPGAFPQRDIASPLPPNCVPASLAGDPGAVPLKLAFKQQGIEPSAMGNLLCRNQELQGCTSSEGCRPSSD